MMQDANVNIIKSGFIYGGIVVSLDNNDARNGTIKLNYATSETLQRVSAHHIFGFFIAKCFSVALLK